jgi:hypothetical protein
MHKYKRIAPSYLQEPLTARWEGDGKGRAVGRDWLNDV